MEMKFRCFLEEWGLTSLKIKAGFLDLEFAPSHPDRAAAWELYVELLTRVTTQFLPPDEGDEKSALASLYAIFPLTREILKKHGSGAGQFAKLAIPVLNQIIRPCTAKWHLLSSTGAFDDAILRTEFRTDLSAVQLQLRNYSKALADMAAVEDLTSLEDIDLSSQ
jgi:hypothetical protein